MLNFAAAFVGKVAMVYFAGEAIDKISQIGNDLKEELIARHEIKKHIERLRKLNETEFRTYEI